MNRSTSWVVLSLALATVAGTSLGVIADRTVLSRDEPKRESRESSSESGGELWFDCENLEAEGGSHPGDNSKWITRMSRDLGLEPEQEEAMRRLFHEHGQSAQQFWIKTRDEYCLKRDALRAGIREILTEEQLETHRARREKRKREREAKAQEREAASQE